MGVGVLEPLLFSNKRGELVLAAAAAAAFEAAATAWTVSVGSSSLSFSWRLLLPLDTLEDVDDREEDSAVSLVDESVLRFLYAKEKKRQNKRSVLL